MSSIRRKNGFSLAEVLLAIGTLAIGMSFIGGTFFVGVHLSTIATERTIAAVTADEAFAKVQLYSIDFSSPELSVDQQVLVTDLSLIPEEEFLYPSTITNADKQYYWSALCRPVYSSVVNRLVQVTVFVSRKVTSDSIVSVPVEIAVSTVAGSGNENKLTIDAAMQTSINAGSKIVANQSGKLYRVVERDKISGNIITLDIPWQETVTDTVWVIPPAGNRKSPCIAVYQKEIRF